MKLERVHLRDFRGFTQLQFDPEADVTVLVGINGAGKSSILDAIRMALQQIPRRLTDEDKRSNDIVVADVRAGAAEATVRVSVRSGAHAATWAVSQPRVGAPQNDTRELMHFLDALSVREGILAGRAQVPLAIHYATHRAVLDIPERIRAHREFGALAAYDHALSTGTSDFRGFFEWFREEEDVFNELRVRNAEWTPGARPPALELVRSAIARLFPAGGSLRIERRPQRMVLDVRGTPLDVAQLSDGEKALLAMTGDIARRMVLADSVSDDPLGQEAVVLIDEIELHLHPGLQRTILARLRDAFPKTQFIVTTHSPQVLSSVHARNVRLLRDFQVVPLERETWRRDTNRILESVFHDPGRPPEIAAKLNELRTAVDEDRFADARRLVHELRSELDGDDPEVVFYEQLLPPIVDTAAQ
jgi:predicted ATP-binding protein involved in virulence